MLSLSVAVVCVLEMLRLPAALLLGPMVAAAACAAMGTRVRVPVPPFAFAQGVIGCMIGRTMTAPVFAEMLRRWPLFLMGVASVVAGSCLLGWLLARWRVLPGSTSLWGSFPGAATAMTLMAESFGADVRLVAFMQYLRVVFVAVVASLLGRIMGAGGHAVPSIAWFPAVDAGALAETILLASMGAWAGRALRIPAGSLLLPILLCAATQDAGLLHVELPPWLLALCYALVGWTIGLRFTRPILAHSARVFPRVAASILSLIALCATLAGVLVWVAGIDPLTAYLATSPGGADSIAIIAASSKVDMPFVMALQTARFVLVLFAGPTLARLIGRTVTTDEPVQLG